MDYDDGCLRKQHLTEFRSVDSTTNRIKCVCAHVGRRMFLVWFSRTEHKHTIEWERMHIIRNVYSSAAHPLHWCTEYAGMHQHISNTTAPTTTTTKRRAHYRSRNHPCRYVYYITGQELFHVVAVLVARQRSTIAAANCNAPHRRSSIWTCTAQHTTTPFSQNEHTNDDVEDERHV